MKLNVCALVLLALIVGLSTMLTIDGDATKCFLTATCAGRDGTTCGDHGCDSFWFGSRKQEGNSYTCCSDNLDPNRWSDCREGNGTQVCAVKYEYEWPWCTGPFDEEDVLKPNTIRVTCF